MRRLALQPAGAEKFSVTVANGDRLACQGVARQVPILIGDEPFSINCVGIYLGCYDFILGIDFLSTLGPILWDLDVLSLIFWRKGSHRVQWTGIGGSGAATPQLQLMAAALDEAHLLLADLLQQHSDIFDEPKGLPPARPCDHRIHLLPDTAPVAVRSYQYPSCRRMSSSARWRSCSRRASSGYRHCRARSSLCARPTAHGTSASTTAPSMP
jgi:hypothetical protein